MKCLINSINPEIICKGRFGGLTVFVLFCVFSFIPSVLNAQVDHPYSIERLNVGTEGQDFVIGPGKVEMEIDPGESGFTNMTVTNRMGDARTFMIEVEDFTGSQNAEQTIVLLGDQRGPYSLKDYISIPDYEFTLANGERATIPVTVSVPQDEEPGGRYGSVIVSTASKKSDTDIKGAGTATIVSRIGVLFFVRIPGGVEEDGHLKDFRTKTEKRMFWGDWIPFEFLFENKGSVHLNPYGEVRIKNWLGKEVGFIEVDPWFALPNSLRFREISWTRPYLMGMYKAEASINRGYGNIIDTDSFTFFVLPWKITSISILAILILVLLVKFLLSRFEIKRKN